jgi:hypothetical protein
MVVLKAPTNRRPRVAKIAYFLKHIKSNPAAALQCGVIERVCREHDYHWRRRELDPATTVALFLQQVLHGNVSCIEVRHFHRGSFSAEMGLSLNA